MNGQNKHYNHTLTYKKGLIEVRLMKDKEALDTYYNDKKSVTNKHALGRKRCKEVLKYWINKTELNDHVVSVSYITDVGVHYVEPVVYRNKSDMAKLMADPLKKRGPSDDSNSAIIEPGMVVYGMVVQMIKIPPIKQVVAKKTANKPKFVAPTLEVPTWD